MNFELNQDALAVAPPGPALQRAAEFYTMSVDEVMLMLLFNDMEVPTWDGKERPTVLKKWLAGRRFGDKAAGPRYKANTMVIGKMPHVDYGNAKPWEPQVAPVESIIGESASALLWRLLEELKWSEANDWYMTNVVRYVPSDRGKTLKPQHIVDSRTLLAQEIALIKPEVILLTGADAVKAVCGKNGTLGSMRGTPFLMRGIRAYGTLPQPLFEAKGVDPAAMKIVATVSPGAVLREGGYTDSFRADLRLARNVSRGESQVSPMDITGRDYTYTSDPEVLGPIVEKLVLQNVTKMALDCEWGGRDFKSGALRTIQFSWGPGKAVVVPITKLGGEPIDPVARHKLIEWLRVLFCRSGVQLIGHNFRSDAKRLEYLGLSVMDYLWHDSLLSDHLLNENAEHGLEACTVRYTDLGRYDIPLAKWLKENNYDKKKMNELGYLWVPDELLYPYAACDVDADFQVADVLDKILHRPENNSLLKLFNEVVMPCNYPLHEAELNGLLIDRDRMISMVDQYEVKKQELLIELQELVGSKKFNPRSYKQASELLFDILKITPFKTTGKPARMWEDILKLPLEDQARYSPSTDAESLESMASDDTGIVAKFRDFKIIDQMTKTFLRGSEIQDDGNEEFIEGLVGSINPVDGRIHTNLSQASETGRQKSSAPNLTNIPKKQDKEFERIMGPTVPKIRSCFIASPGCVIAEADFRSAEVYTLGYLANCFTLIRDAASDLHARGAVNYFGCPKWDGFDQGVKPSKEWLKVYKSERVAGKTINFGIPYQRGAAAVARQIVRETKNNIPCTKEMAQKFIDGFYNTYPEVRNYVDMCKNAVLDPGYVTNAYGRRRRFLNAAREERSTLAAYQREAVNMPIQGTVAETLNVAMTNLHEWRKIYNKRCNYKFCMPVHDAVLIEVPGEEAHIVVEEILPQCMKYGAVVPSWTPVPGYATKPFMLDIDIEIYSRWGEAISVEELKAANVSDKYIKEWAHG